MALRRGPVLGSLLCLVVAVVAAAVLPSAAYPGAPWFEPSKVYDQNFPDPRIVADGAVHYAFGTSTGGAYLPVMTSPDAQTWTSRPRFPQPACVGGPVEPTFHEPLPCPPAWPPHHPCGG